MRTYHPKIYLQRLLFLLIIISSLVPQRTGSVRAYQGFINDAVEPAQASQIDTGVPASVTIAQAIIESGWGDKHIGSANNYFGIKCQRNGTYFGSIATGCVLADTKEWDKATQQYIPAKAYFRTYTNMTDSFRDHGYFFIENSRYGEAMKFTHDPDRFAREIHKAGYATGPTYADSLINMMREYNLYQYNTVIPPQDPNVSYSLTFNPSSMASIGTHVQIGVGANDMATGRAVKSIDVEVNDMHIGAISGNAGSVVWETSGLSARSYTIRFHALLDNWSGNVNTREIEYTLAPFPEPVPGPIPPTPQPCNPSGCFPLEPPPNGVDYHRLTPFVRRGERSLRATCFNWRDPGDWWAPDWVAVYNRDVSDTWRNDANLAKMRIYTSDEDAQKKIGDGAGAWPGGPKETVLCLSAELSESQAKGVWLWLNVGSPPSWPSRPFLDRPYNGSTWPLNEDITLRWNTTSNATQYKVELWGGPYSTMTPCDWQNETSCHIGLMRPGAMSWRVKARNANGQESDWSDTWSFTIQEIVVTTPPPSPSGKPTLSSPGNGSSSPQSTDVTLSWNTSSNATQYKVELWGGPYSTMTPCDWQSGTSCHIGTMHPGTMSWHVRARDASGRESDWSDTWSFTIHNIVATTPPPPSAGKPTLSSPGNGSSSPQSTDITLRWNASSNATQYKVELWGGPYGTMTPCDWQSGTSCPIGQMWPGTISWRVRARDANGKESDWSDTWSFTIQEIVPTTPPSPVGRPTLSSPGSGSSWPQSTDITLTWNGASNAAQYKVELWGGPYSTMTPCDWQSGTSCHIGQMWPGTMSWHVRARDASGRESDWSDTWSFTIQEIVATTPPTPIGRPTLSSPDNGSSWPQSTAITLVWNTTSNAAQYKVELWGGPYSTMIPCDWQSGTSCHIGQMWPGTMSWRVKARNANGQESDWSDTWSFTIQEIVPTTPPVTNRPTLSSPGNGSSWPQRTDITLVWNRFSGATQYKVELWGGPYSTMIPCDWQSATSCHIGQMWPGTMSWRVKARYANGQESEWSDTWNFVIQNP